MEMVRCVGDGIRTTLNLNKENVQAVEKDVQQMQEYLHELAAYWEGPAHDTFHSEFNEGLNFLMELVKRTNEIISFEELALTKYIDADTKAAERVKSFYNRVGA